MNNKSRIVGFISVLTGAIIALTPFQLAPVCDKLLELTTGNMVHMRCHYTGQAEIYLGIIILITGLMIILSKELVVQKRLGLVAIVLGIAVILLPTNLGIGICMMPMECHTTAKVLYILGGITILANIFLQTIKDEVSK